MADINLPPSTSQQYILLDEAAKEIASRYFKSGDYLEEVGIAESLYGSMRKAALTGKLDLFKPNTGLRYMPEENERVLWTRREAVNSWLESDGAHYRLIADDKEPDKSNTDSAWCTSKTLTKGEKQRIAILEAIRNKGYDPMNIPDGGKSVLRGICEHDYPEIFDADTSFDSCWRQGTGTVWEMTNHASYSKRGK